MEECKYFFKTPFLRDVLFIDFQIDQLQIILSFFFFHDADYKIRIGKIKYNH
jgi:hypothetical protein